MVVFYGLGNDEIKYYETKHNIGRLVVEKITKNIGGSFSKKNDFYFYKLNDIYFSYPKGYMNNCGLNLYNFINYFKIDLASDLIILVHDDSDQTSGNIKFVQGGGSGGHHGINSIFKYFQKDINNFWRLKIGIREITNKLRSETFVLSKITESDLFSIDYLVNYISKKIEIFNKKNLSKFQSDINSQNKIFS